MFRYLRNTPPNIAPQRASRLRQSATCIRRVGVGVFSGSLCGLKLVPSKRRCFVLGERQDGAQSRPPVPLKGHNASC